MIDVSSNSSFPFSAPSQAGRKSPRDVLPVEVPFREISMEGVARAFFHPQLYAGIELMKWEQDIYRLIELTWLMPMIKMGQREQNLNQLDIAGTTYGYNIHIYVMTKQNRNAGILFYWVRSWEKLAASTRFAWYYDCDHWTSISGHLLESFRYSSLAVAKTDFTQQVGDGWIISIDCHPNTWLSLQATQLVPKGPSSAWVWRWLCRPPWDGSRMTCPAPLHRPPWNVSWGDLPHWRQHQLILATLGLLGLYDTMTLGKKKITALSWKCWQRWQLLDLFQSKTTGNWHRSWPLRKNHLWCRDSSWPSACGVVLFSRETCHH